MKMRHASAAPTPIPAFAPVERPDEGVSVGVGEAVARGVEAPVSLRLDEKS